MKFAATTAATFLVSILAGPVQADCWSNKAICMAICGAPCCSKAGTNLTTGQGNLSEFSSADLQAEIDGIRATRANKAFVDLIKAEIKSRGPVLKVRPSTSGSTATISN
jgi:hypothetical protein